MLWTNFIHLSSLKGKETEEKFTGKNENQYHPHAYQDSRPFFQIILPKGKQGTQRSMALNNQP